MRSLPLARPPLSGLSFEDKRWNVLIDNKTPGKPAQKSPWHAVSIVARSSACTEALQRRGIRYLSREAPRLPLPACNCGTGCHCVYRHYEDRREGPRRAEETSGIRRGFAPTTEKRTGRGRRATD